MNIPKHIKEHIALGIPWGVGATVTVGNGGNASTLADAITLRNTITHTSLVTATCSSTTDMESRDITADAGTPFTAYVGQHVGVQVAGSGPVFRATVVTSSKLRLKYPLASAIVSQSLTLYSIKAAAIYVLPGTEVDLSASVTLPGYTTLYGIPGTATIRMQQFVQGNSIVFAGDNEIQIFGLDIRQYDHDLTSPSNGQLFVFPQTGSLLEQCNWAVDYCTVSGPHYDTFFFGQSILSGGFRFSNCIIDGYYDIVRLYAMRFAHIYNNQITAKGISGTVDGQVAAVAIGGTSANAYAHQSILIQNNKLQAIYQRVLAGATYDPDQVSCVEVRGKIGSAMRMMVDGNHMRTKVLGAAATSPAYGVSVTNTNGTETPDISVVNNYIDVTTAGVGAADSLNSANANYPIKRAGNIVVAGATGSNTSAITTI